MTLSNLRNEPRREVIEQVIGVIGIVVYLILNYKFARWVYAPKSFWDDPGDLLLMFGALPGLILFILVAHGIGEIICARLKALGLDPRPKQRYRD